MPPAAAPRPRRPFNRIFGWIFGPLLAAVVVTAAIALVGVADAAAVTRSHPGSRCQAEPSPRPALLGAAPPPCDGVRPFAIPSTRRNPWRRRCAEPPCGALRAPWDDVDLDDEEPGPGLDDDDALAEDLR